MTRYFTSDPDAPRVRRAADAVVVVIGFLALVVAGLRVDIISGFETAFVEMLQGLPAWLDGLYKAAYFLGLLFVVVLVVAAVAGRRGDLLRDLLLALVGSTALAMVLARWFEGANPVVFLEFGTVGEPVFPMVRVALVTSMIIVAGPHLSRPARRLGWTIVFLVALSALGLSLGLPSDAAGGVAIGMLVGGGVLLGFGSPAGYPAVTEVEAAMSDLGVEVASTELTPDQSWGVRRFTATTPAGRRIEVKAYGRDATDSQWAARLWHRLWYRDDAINANVSRFQAVEHGALAIFMAQRAAVETPEVLAVGMGGEDTALLATTLDGIPLSNGAVDASDLVRLWEQVARLHDAGIAHRALTLSAAWRDEERLIVGELDAASLVGSRQHAHLDIVSLLYSSAVALDVETAVDIARRGIGDEALADALPYLQLPALNRAQRRETAKPKVVVEELREAVVAATGADPPPDAKLRRVRWQDLIMPALSLVAAYALIGMLSDIDFEAVWEVVRDATWAWIGVGFLIGQFVFFPEASGMLFATGYPLPMRPLTALQVSVKWIGLAVPSAAGRVTMNTLFLRKYGVPPTAAVTQGAIDGISGFVVEAGILVIALIASDISLDLNTQEVRWGLLLGVVLGVIVAGIVTIFRVKRLRETVLPVVREAWGLLRDVIRDPKRGLGLLGSNLASRIVLAITLWFILQAIGTPLPLVTCLVATVATNLLAGLVPIPGGIGVAEATLTSLLALAGLPSEEAFAAAIVFRLATFYIPAGEGFFAMRWLQKGGYL